MSNRHYHPNKPLRETQVQQAPAQAADINNIVGMHLKGPGRMGLPIGNPHASQSMRFIDVPSESYHDMLNRVSRIDAMFQDLPSRVRSRFRNNAGLLLQYVEDPANRDGAIKLGLVLPNDEEFEAMRTAGLNPTAQDASQPAASGPSSPPRPDPEANPTFTQRGVPNPPNPA